MNLGGCGRTLALLYFEGERVGVLVGEGMVGECPYPVRERSVDLTANNDETRQWMSMEA